MFFYLASESEIRLGSEVISPGGKVIPKVNRTCIHTYIYTYIQIHAYGVSIYIYILRCKVHVRVWDSIFTQENVLGDPFSRPIANRMVKRGGMSCHG